VGQKETAFPDEVLDAVVEDIDLQITKPEVMAGKVSKSIFVSNIPTSDKALINKKCKPHLPESIISSKKRLRRVRRAIEKTL
jgi:hypothetical protein